MSGTSARLRLGYLVPEFPSQTHIFFWREAEALEQLGLDVRWLSTRRPPPDACRHAFAERGRAATRYLYPPRAGAALGYLLRHPRGTLRALAYVAGLRESRLAQRLRALLLLPCAAGLAAAQREQPLDHLHVHSCADSAHLAALFQRLTGVPYSLTLHGDLPVYGRDHAAKMARAAFVAVVTADLQRQVLERVGLPVERVPVIRMGVDTSRFDVPPPRPLEPRRLHVVTVARLAECKGHRFALEAVGELVREGLDVSYSIAGGGPDRGLIEGHIARLGLGQRVRLVGTLAEDEVLRLVQSADAFVLPSVGYGEAAPVAVMEAMACGTPSVCSIIGGTPELITDGADGFLTRQGDAAAIAAALRRLATDLDERRRMSQAARRRALEAFDHRRWAAALSQHVRATAPAPRRTG